MKAMLVKSHVKTANDINLEWIDKAKPILKDQECLIQVIASGINPSDALAVLGYFPHAVVPRIPGRDFSGIVVDGPKALIGKKVWGTGGAAGISFDGTQAEYIKLSVSEISEIPTTLDPVVAGAQPLPYVTAYYSLVKRAHIEENETVVVIGALGQVGSAAMSICHWKKCTAIALVRGTESVAQAQSLGWKAINTDDTDLADKILAANHGRPVQVILNSVGNSYWPDLMKSLAEFGRIVTIGARENVREVTVNLFDLYRANQDIMGINSVSLNFSQNAELLNELKMGFEAKQLTPLQIDPTKIYPPEQASDAYREVMQGTSGKRVVIKF